MEPVITSRSNVRVKLLRAAAKGRPQDAEGLIVLEGPTLISEATQAGVPLHTVFVRQDVDTMLEFGTTPVLVLSRDVFESSVATEQSQGVAALLSPPEHPFAWTKNSRVLVLWSLQDPGNVGTLIRSAEAFGMDAVVVCGGGVNTWNSKAVRASAGSVLRVPIVKMELDALKQKGLWLIAAVARDGATPQETDWKAGCALVIGNEGAGLSDEVLDLCDARVTIPMPGAIESLNAAVAGSILLYEAVRQRGAR